MGATAYEILSNLGPDVIALTRANFTAESRAVYKGSSSFTRCVWEVKLGHVDLCVGEYCPCLCH